jgi:hypothetical protein
MRLHPVRRLWPLQSGAHSGIIATGERYYAAVAVERSRESVVEGGAIEMDFDLLDHLVRLVVPERKASTAWMHHAPPGMLLVVDLVLPTPLVELGASTGVAYCTFCTFVQAVDTLRLSTCCFAADTRGDAPCGGHNSDDVFEDLKKDHEHRYGALSTLLRSALEDAVCRFVNRSIDPLHINGPRAYQAARHDVETWLLKMSRRGILIPLGINDSASEAVVSVGSATACGMQVALSMRTERAMAPHETLYALRQRLKGIQRVEALCEHSLVTERRVRVQVDELAAKHEVRHIEAARQVAQAHQLAAEHIIEASLQVARVRELAEDRFRSEREELTARFHSDLVSLRQQLATTTAQLAASQGELAWLNSSRGVRAVKLARAARATLTQRGPRALAQRVGSWLLGKRGYHLRDIPAAGATQTTPTEAHGVQVLE